MNATTRDFERSPTKKIPTKHKKINIRNMQKNAKKSWFPRPVWGVKLNREKNPKFWYFKISKIYKKFPNTLHDTSSNFEHFIINTRSLDTTSTSSITSTSSNIINIIDLTDTIDHIDIIKHRSIHRSHRRHRSHRHPPFIKKNFQTSKKFPDIKKIS